MPTGATTTHMAAQGRPHPGHARVPHPATLLAAYPLRTRGQRVWSDPCREREHAAPSVGSTRVPTHSEPEVAARSPEHESDSNHSEGHLGMYVRFGAMILTAMVVMYAVMFVSSWEWSHIRLSEVRTHPPTLQASETHHRPAPAGALPDASRARRLVRLRPRPGRLSASGGVPDESGGGAGARCACLPYLWHTILWSWQGT